MEVYSKQIDILFSPGVSNLMKAYTDILEDIDSRELKTLSATIFSRLKNARKLKTTNVLLIGSILKLSGIPPGKLLDFFAGFLKEKISLQHYTFCLNVIFSNSAPLPSSILFDLTEYTYLDRNVILKKSMGLSRKLQKMKSADLVLFLLILSYRKDLSNENLKLILLLLKSIATKSALQKIGRPHFKILNGMHDTQKDIVGASGKSRAVRHTQNSEHASYYLDKHFSDRRGMPEEPDPEPIRRISSHHVQKQPEMPEPVLTEAPTPATVTAQKEEHNKSAQTEEGKPIPVHMDSTIPGPAPPATILYTLKRWRKVWIPALLFAIAVGTYILFATGNTGKSVNTAKRGLSTAQVAETVPGDGIFVNGSGSSIQNNYTVKKGDTLSGISKKYYNDANRYTAIAEKNNLSDPNLIYPGSTLIIPAPEEK